MPDSTSPFLDWRGVLNIIGLMSPVIITFLVFFSGAIGGLMWATFLILTLSMAALVNERFITITGQDIEPEKLLKNMSYNCGVFKIPGDSIQSVLPFRIIFHLFTFTYLLSNAGMGGSLNGPSVGFIVVLGLLSLGDIIRLSRSKCYDTTSFFAAGLYGAIAGLIGLASMEINRLLVFFKPEQGLTQCYSKDICQ
jgi:hypothetical protein